MKRHLLVLLFALLAGSPFPARAQTATPPAAPAPPAPPDPNVRRHRMGDASRDTLDVKVQIRSAMDEQVKALRRQIAELEAQLSQGRDEATLKELERLRLELKEIDTLELPEVPDVVITGPDQAGLVLKHNGGQVVIIDPDGKSLQIHKARGDWVVLFNNLYVNHDDWIDGPAVAILGNVHVIGHVEQDVVSIGGNVYVEGTVGGNVVAPFGDVVLSGDAAVEGDVVAVSVTADDETAIGGTIEEVPLFRLPWVNGGPHAFLLLASTVTLVMIVITLLFGLLVAAVAPRHVARVQERLKQKPAGSFFGGLLFQILLLPVFVLLLVTVIGIPVALLALPLVVLAAQLLGFVAFSRILGESLLHRDGGQKPAMLLFTAGALLLVSPLLLASLLAVTAVDPGASLLLAVNLLFFLGLCVLSLVYPAGMGAAVLSRLGTRSPASIRPLAPVVQAPSTALPQAPPAPGAS